jgi:hypothetical protein
LLDLLIRARLEGELSDRSRNNLYLALCTILRAHQRSSLCCFFVSCRVICCFLLQQRDRVSFCRNNKIQNYFRGGVIRVRHTSSNELDYFTVPYGTCNFNLVQYLNRRPAEQPSSNNFEGGATIEQQLWHPSTPFFGGDRRHSYRNRSTPTSKWPACTGTSDATKKPTTMTRKYQLTRTTHPTTKHPTPNKAAQP